MAIFKNDSLAKDKDSLKGSSINDVMQVGGRVDVTFVTK